MRLSTLCLTPFAPQNKPVPVVMHGCLLQMYHRRTRIPKFFHKAPYACSLSCRWYYYGDRCFMEMNFQVTEVYSLGCELQKIILPMMDFSSRLNMGDVLFLLIKVNYFCTVPSGHGFPCASRCLGLFPGLFVSSCFFCPLPLLPLLRWFFSQLFTVIVIKLYFLMRALLM